MSSEKTILVTGATGYIGARLVPRLLKLGYRVRAVSRSLQKLQGYNWASHENVELVAADVLDEKAIVQACTDCNIAFYLVHSMNSQQRDFAEADRRAASNRVHTFALFSY